MEYVLTISGLTVEQGKDLYALAIGVPSRSVFGQEGMSWGPARHHMIGCASVSLAPMQATGTPKARDPHPVPFCLVRSLDTAEIRTFGGYVGQGRFIAVDAFAGQSDEEHVADWECIDGHGGMIDWPKEG